jgi:hypothetical protein
MGVRSMSTGGVGRSLSYYYFACIGIPLQRINTGSIVLVLGAT